MLRFEPGMLGLWIHVIITYTVSFYLFLPVRLTGRQRIIHLFITCIWAYFPVAIVMHMTNSAQYILEVLLETGYQYLMILLFTEGDFFYNVIRQSLASQLGNILGTGVIMLIDKDFMNTYFVMREYSAVKPATYLLYITMIALAFILEKPLFDRVLQYKVSSHFLYRVIFALFWISYIHEYIVRLQEEFYSGTQMHIIYSVLYSSVALLIMIIIYIISLNTSLKYQKNSEQKEHAQMLLRYQNLTKANDRMLKLRHEFNRQMDIVKTAKQYIPSEAMNSYLAQLDDISKDFLTLSQSGLLFLDAAIEYNYSSLKQYDLIPEIIIMPFQVSEELTEDIILITNDLFEYIKTKHKRLGWYRFTIRKRESQLFLSMQAGYNNRNNYIISRLSNFIFDNFMYFDYLGHIAAISRKRDGIFESRILNNELTLNAMIPIQEHTGSQSN